eukprot:TRINITY_DN23554_c0_g1_i1.p1 TRINITY_DN23554_c0_g1~~TRINITY_DN23554_c0_g1_i1.p1  ORF type:complete len:899 (-),score=181.94 TRINITY_DN23554_c0_g1_i1:334-3030(-)
MVDEYAQWSADKLKNRLRELGATATGSKDALLTRLRALAPAVQRHGESAAMKRPAADSLSSPPAKRAKERDPVVATGTKPATSGLSGVSVSTKKYFEDGDFKAEYAKSAQSTCKKCKDRIEKNDLRIGKMEPSDRFDGFYPVWHHWKCFVLAGLLPRSTSLIQGFSTLRAEDQKEIAKVVPAGGKGGSGKDVGVNTPLGKQNAKVFHVQDAVSQLSVLQIKSMLELNGYPSAHRPAGTATLQELCADGIVFGATGSCKDCGGSLLLSGEGYSCDGWINDYLRCSFRTQKPKRALWQLTPEACKVAGGSLAGLKLGKGDRLFAAKLTSASPKAGGSPSADQAKPPLFGLTIAVIEDADTMTRKNLADYIRDHGGAVLKEMTKAADCVVVSSSCKANVRQKAEELGVPGVTDLFVRSSVKKGEPQDMGRFLVWGEARRKRKVEETVTSKFIEKEGVQMDADVGDLAKKAHVLVDRSAGLVYSEMMTRTDLVSGGNSFYTLCVLESDKINSPEYWVFRKWGRIGVSQGGIKIEECGSSREKAVKSFCKQYLDKTGNEFGHKLEDFKVRKGAFVRVDLVHKALEHGGKRLKGSQGGSGEGDAQPLGKLSKKQIEKGDKVLDLIGAALGSGVKGNRVVSPKLLGLSAEYYTLVPHNFGAKKPPPIATQAVLGAEKALLSFYLRMGFEELDKPQEKLAPIAGVMKLECPETLAIGAKGLCASKDINECETKGAALEKKKAGKPRKALTGSLYGSILLYTSNAIYQQLNKVLRDEDRSRVEKYFPYLRMLFEACARLPSKSRVLWRGVGVDLFDSYKVGAVITWWGVSSCTSDKKVAQDFTAGCGEGATMLTLQTETACDISDLSFYANEAESILLPGTKLKVLSATKSGKKSEITLKEVGRVVG